MERAHHRAANRRQDHPPERQLRRSRRPRVSARGQTLARPIAIKTASLPAPGRGRFEALDSLRGIAALGVAYGHFYGPDILGGAYHFAYYLLVDLFFVLSGFVLAHRYLDEWLSRRVSLGTFALHRFARLYPLHLYGLLGVLAISLVSGWLYAPPTLHGWDAMRSGIENYADGPLFTFILSLFLAQNIGFTPLGPSWHAPSWSISVEFYAPLLLFFWIGLWRENRNTTFVAPTVLLALACVLAVVNGEGSLAVGGHDILPWVNYGMMRCLSEAAVGVIAYRCFRRYGEFNRTSALTGTAVEIVLLVFAGLLLFRRPFISHEDIFVIPVFAALIYWLASERGAIAKILSTRPFRAIGRLSYSIYINHYLIVLATAKMLWRPGWLYFGIVLLLSWCTVRWIEAPARRAINQRFSAYV